MILFTNINDLKHIEYISLTRILRVKNFRTYLQYKKKKLDDLIIKH